MKLFMVEIKVIEKNKGFYEHKINSLSVINTKSFIL